jgi:hypothetical protein
MARGAQGGVFRRVVDRRGARVISLKIALVCVSRPSRNASGSRGRDQSRGKRLALYPMRHNSLRSVVTYV